MCNKARSLLVLVSAHLCDIVLLNLLPRALQQGGIAQTIFESTIRFLGAFESFDSITVCPEYGLEVC